MSYEDTVERIMQHLDDPEHGYFGALDTKIREMTRLVLALLVREEWDWRAKRPADHAEVGDPDLHPSVELTPAEQWVVMTSPVWPELELDAINAATIALAVAVAVSAVRRQVAD